MKGLKIIVLAKQVPDTPNVGQDAMKADGTVNRASLEAIFNPEDLNALEMALEIKDQNPGSEVAVLTMGPGRAAEVIREGLYRGAHRPEICRLRYTGHFLYSCSGYPENGDF